MLQNATFCMVLNSWHGGKKLVLLLRRSIQSLNELFWLLIKVCRGWLTLSRISSSLLDVLLFATVTESSFMLTTEPACLISLSNLDESFFDVLRFL